MNVVLLALSLATAGPDPANWPLQPRPEVVRGFELPAKPWLPGHRGVDLTGSPGQPVRAATSGTVTYAGQLAGRGVVAVSHGARRTTYEPVVPAVTVGTPVTTTTVIGHLSGAGSHCSPATCLHWGLVEGKRYLNPLTLLPDRPVRLLPLSSTPAAAGAPVVHSTASPPPQPVRSTASPPPSGSNRTGAIVVASTAALALAGGLLLKRH
ncbi:M23 family metallopeptidase [Kribbella pittospori]|uniref:M23 family metallopeptidase n=1 Tax=Kribbella pittospori TaxID=722689 RepID=A0A4R0KNQ9_9ACTN|nr:M23 family metallopeptidase [Kribbella pittospori]TCC61840.1 M23 family metallopeptidase [Kribbella pittospori]